MRSLRTDKAGSDYLVIDDDREERQKLKAGLYQEDRRKKETGYFLSQTEAIYCMDTGIQDEQSDTEVTKDKNIVENKDYGGRKRWQKQSEMISEEKVDEDQELEQISEDYTRKTNSFDLLC